MYNINIAFPCSLKQIDTIKEYLEYKFPASDLNIINSIYSNYEELDLIVHKKLYLHKDVSEKVCPTDVYKKLTTTGELYNFKHKMDFASYHTTQIEEVILMTCSNDESSVRMGVDILCTMLNFEKYYSIVKYVLYSILHEQIYDTSRLNMLDMYIDLNFNNVFFNKVIYKKFEPSVKSSIINKVLERFKLHV